MQEIERGEIKAAFAAWVAARRQECGYPTQAALAKAGNFNPASVHRWENGATVPSEPGMVRALAKALRTPVPEMLVRTGHLTQEEAHIDKLPEPEPVPDPLTQRAASFLDKIGEQDEDVRDEIRKSLINFMDAIDDALNRPRTQTR
jgi:transcriptional regulator with XRE-family HTH domain